MSEWYINVRLVEKHRRVLVFAQPVRTFAASSRVGGPCSIFAHYRRLGSAVSKVSKTACFLLFGDMKSSPSSWSRNGGGTEFRPRAARRKVLRKRPGPGKEGGRHGTVCKDWDYCRA